MRICGNKLLLRALLVALLVSLTLPAVAQGARLELKNLEKLNSKAVEVNDITLDGPMLQLAIKFLATTDDPDAKRVSDVVKDLKGIYVKSFTFDQPNQYSQADVEDIRSQLAGPRWSKIVESRTQQDHEHDEIYVMKEGDKIAGVAILVAEARELTVVNLIGLIDIEKLGNLAGEFGIPRSIKEQPKPKPKPEAESTHEKK